MESLIKWTPINQVCKTSSFPDSVFLLKSTEPLFWGTDGTCMRGNVEPTESNLACSSLSSSFEAGSVLLQTRWIVSCLLCV